MEKEQLHEPLYQAMETEMGGVEIYETAVSLAQNATLREEWQESARAKLARRCSRAP